MCLCGMLTAPPNTKSPQIHLIWYWLPLTVLLFREYLILISHMKIQNNHWSIKRTFALGEKYFSSIMVNRFARTTFLLSTSSFWATFWGFNGMYCALDMTSLHGRWKFAFALLLSQSHVVTRIRIFHYPQICLIIQKWFRSEKNEEYNRKT